MKKLTKKFLSIIFSRNFILFFIVSGIGLCLDLLIFYFLTKTDLDIFLVNVVSSFCAVSFVYFCSTQHVFKEAQFSAKNFIVFVSYYAASISLFSLLIKIIVITSGILPILAKIAVVPLSLLLNYFFASRIISKK